MKDGHLGVMLAAKAAQQIMPDQRVTCAEHQCWNDVVHREREHS